MISVSIIIVNFFLEDELFNCLKSIYNQKIEHTFEVIIVDNGSKANFSLILQEKFPKIIYISSQKNLGFGAGNNLGSIVAKGKYLFFLNPDTVMYPGCVDILVRFIHQQKNCGIVAPNLVHKNGKYFNQQGSLVLTPLRAIAAHSIISRVWPDNPLARKFWVSTADKNADRNVEIVPGTAFMMSKELFKQVGKFDPNYFLYFEEYDICKRVLETGKSIWMLANAKVYHKWGASTQKNEKSAAIYIQSFLYYLVKHYGIRGCIAFLITRISASLLVAILLFLIIVVFLTYSR